MKTYFYQNARTFNFMDKSSFNCVFRGKARHDVVWPRFTSMIEVKKLWRHTKEIIRYWYCAIRDSIDSICSANIYFNLSQFVSNSTIRARTRRSDEISFIFFSKLPIGCRFWCRLERTSYGYIFKLRYVCEACWKNHQFLISGILIEEIIKLIQLYTFHGGRGLAPFRQLTRLTSCYPSRCLWLPRPPCRRTERSPTCSHSVRESSWRVRTSCCILFRCYNCICEGFPAWPEMSIRRCENALSMTQLGGSPSYN